MSLKHLSVLFLLSASSFMLTEKAHADGMCLNPLKEVCENTTVQRQEREKYIKFLKEEIRLEAQAPTLERVKKMEKEIPKYRLIKRFFQKIKINNQEIMKAAKTRMPVIEKVINNPETLALIMRYFDQAISKSNFANSTKDIFKNTISQVKILNFDEYLKILELEDKLIAQLLSNPCGSDGLVSNAFATKIKNQRVVVICPGYMIDSSINDSEERQLQAILQVIGHEIGHHIDAHATSVVFYDDYLTCISRNHAKGFNKSKADKKFCENKKTTKEECADQVTISHAGELVADVWGIKVLNEHIKENSLSFGESSTLLANSFKKLCGSKDEGTHPSGDFRIGTHILLQPEVSELLACQSNESVEQCTF